MPAACHWRLQHREITEPDPTVEAELQELAEALREHLLWQRSCGADALPRAERPLEAVRFDEPVEAVSAQVSRTSQVRTERPSRGPVVSAEVQVPAATRAPEFDVPAEPEARWARLQQLATQTMSCTRCPLHAARAQAVFSRGTPVTELMFVGEGPGAEEDAQGEPFVGKAGQLLDRMIKAMGLDRDQVYICNIVKCRPPDNRTPEPEEMAACMPYLHEQIALVQPKVIVALGATAAKGLLGISEGITRLRGKWRLYRASIPVMPTFHPAYLLRKEEAKRDVWNDLKAVMKQLGRPVPGR